MAGLPLGSTSPHSCASVHAVQEESRQLCGGSDPCQGRRIRQASVRIGPSCSGCSSWALVELCGCIRQWPFSGVVATIVHGGSGRCLGWRPQIHLLRRWIQQGIRQWYRCRGGRCLLPHAGGTTAVGRPECTQWRRSMEVLPWLTHAQRLAAGWWPCELAALPIAGCCSGGQLVAWACGDLRGCSDGVAGAADEPGHDHCRARG
jgi:hypothetical protein